MIIDAATVADTEALHTLVNAAYRGHGGMAGWTSETEFMDGTRVDLPSLREQLREGQPAILLLRTEAGTAPIGCISVGLQADTTWYISMLAIAPGHQDQGLGRELLTEAEQYARNHGATRARMTVIQLRESLIGWYERRGYELTGETEAFPYNDERFGKPRRDDLHFVVLEKTLADPA